MYPYDNSDQLAWQAAKYDLLSNYYKYSDPQKHVYYYQRHFECMQRLMMHQHGGQMRMAGMNGQAKVRVLHASPDAPAVDIYVNGQKILEGVPFKQQSDYLSVAPGQYQIDIYPQGETNQPVLSQSVTVEAGKMYTVAAAGKVDNLQLITVADNTTVPSGNSKARFWHLSPNAPAVDIAVKGGNVLFRNVSFGEATNYLTLPPTTADLEVRVAGTNQVALEIPGVTLNPNQAYTAVAVGLAGGQPPLEAIFLQP
ncbi:DUF4397 domain-containing protein [Halobacillus mangrovi]|uniref:DUF4397 domain-containing protein n=1 Tax=Halobacillus mangrovi TaxID=402384 RepID=UPI003D96FF91